MTALRTLLFLATLAWAGSACICDNLPRPFACRADSDCRTGHLCINGACQGPCPGGARNLDTDVDNCGSCGNVCPAPLHATARCLDGGCGRGPCDPGYFHFNPSFFGCETACVQNVCHFPDGGTATLSSSPLPETGLVQQTIAAGSSVGGWMQTSSKNTNFGTLGQSTPLALDGGVVQRSSTTLNVGGFFVVPGN